MGSQRYDFVAGGTNTHTFTVPSGVRRITVKIAGAKGGNVVDPEVTTPGGTGETVTFNRDVTPGEQFTITLGGKGGDATSSTGGLGGENGGGAGGSGGGVEGLGGSGGGGKTGFASGATTLAVAAGGGGASYLGDGGNASGGDGWGHYPGQGATATAHGAGGDDPNASGEEGTAGSALGGGTGGDAVLSLGFSSGGGGGGAGHFSGGGGSSDGGGGAGYGLHPAGSTLGANAIASGHGWAEITWADPPTISPSGFADANAFGSPRVARHVAPTGVGTAQALGTPKVNRNVKPSGVASAQAFGSPTINPPQTVSPASVAPGETFHNHHHVDGGVSTSISFVASSFTSTGNTAQSSIDIAKPAGTRAGDVMIAVVNIQDNTGPSIVAPVGWTELNFTTDTSMRSAVYWKAADALDGDTFTWTWAPMGRQACGAIATYRGVNTTSPVHFYALRVVGSTATSEETTPTLTTTKRTWLLGIHARRSGELATNTAVAVREYRDGLGFFDSNDSLDAGSVGGVRSHCTVSSDSGVLWSIALNPNLEDASQTVTPSGVVSGELVGAARVVKHTHPTGIASGQAFGTLSVSRNVKPTAFIDPSQVGLNLTVTPGPVARAVDGIASSEALGTPNVRRVISPSAIASLEALGIPTQTNIRSLPVTGIASGEVVPGPRVRTVLQPSSIATSESSGAPSITNTPLTFIASQQAHASSVTSISVPSAGASPGDLMLVFVVTNSLTLPDIGHPSGWTRVSYGDDAPIRTALYWKFKTSSDPSSFTFTFSSLTSASTSTVVFRGAHSNPIHAFNGEAETSTLGDRAHGTGGITTTARHRALLFFGSSGQHTCAQNSGRFQELVDVQSSNAANNRTLAVYQAVSIVDGAATRPSETIETSGDVADAVGWQVAIREGEQVVAPPSTPSAESVGTPTVVRGAVTVTPSSILTAEGAGTPRLALISRVNPSSIGTGEAVGTPKTTLFVKPTTIASGEALGSPKNATLQVSAGVASQEATSSPKLNLTLRPSSVVQTEAVGAPTLQPGPVAVTGVGGIASAEAVSQVRLSTDRITGTSIPSEEAFGSPTLHQNVKPGSAASSEAVGTLKLTTQHKVSGIASLETFGSPKLDRPLPVSGVASQERVGSVRILFRVFASSVGSTEAFGTLAISRNLKPQAIPSAQSVGSPEVTRGYEPDPVVDIDLQQQVAVQVVVTTTKGTAEVSLSCDLATALVLAELVGAEVAIEANRDTPSVRP